MATGGLMVLVFLGLFIGQAVDWLVHDQPLKWGLGLIYVVGLFGGIGLLNSAWTGLSPYGQDHSREPEINDAHGASAAPDRENR